MTQANKYYALMIFQSLLPLIIFIVCFIVHIVLIYLTKCIRMFTLPAVVKKSVLYGNNFQAIKLNTYISASVLLYVVYPNMVMQLLGSVHCFKALADGPGDVMVKRLRNHPEILCTDTDYLRYRDFVFIPAIIIWVACFPVFLVMNFFSKKLNIYNS